MLPPEDAELLRNFSLICMLSYDVYVKKTIIERLIDTTTSDRLKSRQEKNKINQKPQARAKVPVLLWLFFICLYCLSVFCMRLNTMS